MCTFLTEPEIPVGPTDNRKKMPAGFRTFTNLTDFTNLINDLKIISHLFQFFFQ